MSFQNLRARFRQRAPALAAALAAEPDPARSQAFADLRAQSSIFGYYPLSQTLASFESCAEPGEARRALEEIGRLASDLPE